MADSTPIIMYSTDPVSDSTPSWTDATADLRSYSVSRGRETELSDVDPGRATIVLNDRARTYDPDFNSAIKPLNRWWIRETYGGGTYDVFMGYAEAYQEEWVAGAEEARTVVACVDEFKLLNLARLPTMNPPRDTYADVVLFDRPQEYWPFAPVALGTNMIAQPTVGEVGLAIIGGTGSVNFTTSPIIGDSVVNLPTTSPGVGLARSTSTALTTFLAPADFDALPVFGPGDVDDLSTFTFEMWFASSEATPAANREIAVGPLSGGNPQWQLTLLTSGAIRANFRQSDGTLYGTDSPGSITADTWYHLAVVVGDGNFIRLFVNGVQVNFASAAGVGGDMDAGGYLQLGTATAVGGIRYFDDIAFYRHALDGTRLLAHYQAGALRGFPAQDPGARIAAVLDAAGNAAARSLRAGSRELVPAFMHGQSPLEEMRIAEAGDAVDAVLFVAADGTITFLDDGHRSVAPWNAVQATFDDTSTEWWYQDIGVDYSDSFIANEWNVTREGGTTQSASDSTSISQYGPRTQSLTGLKIKLDADADAIADAMLAKYKDPMRRITRLEKYATTSAVITNLLQREIGDRIRIIRHPPGGGSAKDQTAFIQKIEVTMEPGRPRRFVLSVSPL